MAEQDLIPLDRRTKEEQKKIARQGGIASGKARRQKKQMHELVKLMMDSKPTEKQAASIMKQFPDLEGEDITIASAMVAGQVQAAIKGNTKAFNALNELSSRAANQEDQPKWTIPITDITVDFVEIYRTVHKAYETGHVREIISKGGRGSIKSNFWSAVAEETIYQDPQAHVVFTRRYKTDTRGSIYNQFIKTVTRHGKVDEWDFTTSPMEATYKKTGQKVLFLGCDKPISLKSFNLTFGYVKLLIHEECDEMAGIEQMDNVEDTFLRNDTPALDVKVFNPPASVNNFMNIYADECKNKEGTVVHHSYYYNVPVEWLGQRFFDRAEWFKEHKPVYYANNYLGEVTGTGGLVFENIVERKITDEEAKTLSYRYYGLDWGYKHPQAFMEIAYDSETDTIYLLSEVVSKRMKQDNFAKKIKKHMKDEIIADSARPDLIDDYSDYGFEIIGATKYWRGGGRSALWEWLQQRTAIVIDPERTPQAYKQFKRAEFEKLRDGTFSSAYPTLDEDCIMATGYALNRVIMSEKEEIPYEDDDEEI